MHNVPIQQVKYLRNNTPGYRLAVPVGIIALGFALTGYNTHVNSNSWNDSDNSTASRYIINVYCNYPLQLIDIAGIITIKYLKCQIINTPRTIQYQYVVVSWWWRRWSGLSWREIKRPPIHPCSRSDTRDLYNGIPWDTKHLSTCHRRTLAANLQRCPHPLERDGTGRTKIYQVGNYQVKKPSNPLRTPENTWEHTLRTPQ